MRRGAHSVKPRADVSVPGVGAFVGSHLLQQLLGSVQLLPMKVQAGVQVPDLLPLHLDLVR